jgi:cytochrome c-type biogenesis protein CcmE
MKHRKLKIGATLFIAVAGVAFIANQSLSDDTSYYMHVEKVVAEPQKWMDKKTIQVHGFVQPGSIRENIRGQKMHTTFRLQNNGQQIEVRHAGIKPDTFKDLAETVVAGTLREDQGELYLAAIEGETGIMAKCPSKYDGQR